MKTLPNGVIVFNATPHVIRFWHEDWDEPVEVETEEVISASVKETIVASDGVITLVKTEFVPQIDDAESVDHLIAEAYEMGADVVVGSIIAAQAYPGVVVAMVPCAGYERVPQDQKRMRPDKFTVFEKR